MSLRQFMEVNEAEPETPEQQPEPKKEDITLISEPETEEIAEFLEECRKNRENWAYVSASYVCDYRIDEKVEGLKVTQNVERPFKSEDDSYGGMWGTSGYTKESINEFLEDTRKFIQGYLEQPYKEKLKESETSFLRDIKDRNVRVFISDKAKELLKENGINADEYLSEVNGMKGRTVTDEELELCEKYKTMEMEIERLEKRIKDIRDTVCRNFEISTIYGTCRNSKEGLNHFTDTIDFNILHREYVESDGLISGYNREKEMIRNYFYGR